MSLWKVNKLDDKLSKTMQRMLGVSSINDIVFEENDGTEIPFHELFEYRTSIGAGGFGFVVAVLDKSTGEEVALKLLWKENTNDKVIDLFRKEAETLKSFNHPHWVKFKFYKYFSNFLLLGMELWVGGTLTDWIRDQREIKNQSIEKYEEQCGKIIKNILLGIQYIHDSHEIIHRDIKPGNILFLHKNDINSLKICDFGLANKVGIGLFDQNYEKVGTIMYQAPEQMNESPYYSKPIDIWATGMIMYEMLSRGGHPILGKDIYQNVLMTVNEYKETMNNDEVKFKITKHLKHVSKLAKSLLKNLCQLKPNNRYNCSKALKHPWVTGDKNGAIPLNFHQELELHSTAMNFNAKNKIFVENFTDSEDSDCSWRNSLTKENSSKC